MAGDGATGTVPVSGQAYVAVGGGVAAVGAGLTVTGYGLRDGRQLWQATLAGPDGAAVMSVRAWDGVVTAGLAGPNDRTRTEVVIDSATGAVLRRYQAATFGGAVAASPTTSVIIGPRTVTSYDNATGTVLWRRTIGADQAWRADGRVLYVTESPEGYLGSAPIAGLRVIDLISGSERTLDSPPGHPFSGTMSVATQGVLLFTSADGVTAFSGSTGGTLWSMAGAVPEGADPVTHLAYLTTAGGVLVGVDPLSGAVKAWVPGSTAGGSASMYVVRAGVALGLDRGEGGEAWGYNFAVGRVTWTAPGLPWPHYFSDLSGLGGSAAVAGDMVVVATCARLAASAPSPTATVSPSQSASQTSSPTAVTTPPLGAASAAGFQAMISLPTATPSPSPTASPSSSPAPPVHLCAVPELVALNV
jgi:hypothetical protein